MAPDGEIEPAADLPGCGPIRPVPDASNSAHSLALQVLERVRAEGLIARVDLAKSLDVSPATITALVAGLIDRGLVVEKDRPVRQGQRGRPPTALALVPTAAYVIGLKLAEFRHSAVLMDFAGRVVAEAALDRADPQRDLVLLTREISDLIASLMRSAGLPIRAVRHVGVGLPGFIDAAAGKIAWSPLLPAEDLAFATHLEAHLDLPVAIDNDANLLTLAELWFGHGRRVADFAVVTIEQGIGMGLAINHQLYRGVRAFGMELGHTKVQLDGALCRCGQRGCLEAYVSDYALVREASTALDLSVRHRQSAQVILDALHDQAKAGNEAARSIFRRAGRYMALGLANVFNIFEPELIVVSGARLRYDYLYADEVLSEMQSLILKTGRGGPRIEINAWGEFGWAKGGAALALTATTATLAQDAAA
ncbi:MAG: ROK family protein [Pseudomonadota bacterium]